MNRKIFLTQSLAASVSMAIVGSLKNYAVFNDNPQNGFDNRILVIVQLDGGNDGLNTVIPIDQYKNLIEARKNILIPENKILPLYNSSITGLHPSLVDLQKIYSQKKLTIIQGVGSHNTQLSHFKAIDNWHSASDSNDSVSTGWIGRFLEQKNHSLSSTQISDPTCIQIKEQATKASQGSKKNIGMVVYDTENFYDLVPGKYDSVKKTVADNQLFFIRNAIQDSKKYWLRVKAAAMSQKNLSDKYPAPGENPLADQLKIVAQLIGGGLKTKIYTVTLKGFDTHDQQVDTSDPTKGDHSDLLSKLSKAIAAFDEDISLMGRQDQVLGMVFSEFGRRIKSNSSYGCDHGTAAPVILFGPKLHGGIEGINPAIPVKTMINDNLHISTDFRSVYASILKGWFGKSESEIGSILMGNFPVFDLFHT